LLRHKFLCHKIPKQGCIFFNLKSIEDYYEEDDDEDVLAPALFRGGGMTHDKGEVRLELATAMKRSVMSYHDGGVPAPEQKDNT